MNNSQRHGTVDSSSEDAGSASWRRVVKMIGMAYTRAEAEAATAALKEHERRYPNQVYYVDHFPDPWPAVLDREEDARQLGLSPQEHEEREHLLHYMNRAPEFDLPAEHLDLPGHLDRLIALLRDWMRRHPNDESMRGRLRWQCFRRCMADAFWGDPLKPVGPNDGRSPEERYRPWRTSEPNAKEPDGLTAEEEECMQSSWAERYKEAMEETGERKWAETLS